MNNNKPSRKRKSERIRYPRLLQEIDGESVLCATIPVARYERIMRTRRDMRKKIINLDSKVNYYKRSMKIIIDNKINEIDLLIERLTK